MMSLQRGARALARSRVASHALQHARAAPVVQAPFACRSFNDYSGDSEGSSQADSGDGAVFKTELIEMVAIETGLAPRDVGKVLNSTLDKIIATVTDENKVVLTGFGTFSHVNRNARMGRNPQTGEALSIPAKVAPKFKPSPTFKRRVNGE